MTMRLHSCRTSGQLSSDNKLARIRRGEMTPKTATKYKRREDGKLVKLRRVRRKKKPADTAHVPSDLNALQNNRRVTSTSELGKAAPVQAKPDSDFVKKARYRSITPGTANMVIKANPSPHKRPLNTLDTVI